MISEERKFLTFERIKREKIYNMAIDYPEVILYAHKNFDISISEEEYFELFGSYPELRKKYFKWLE